MRKFIYRIFSILLLGVLLCPFTACSEMWPKKNISSFEECVADGNTILRTEPPRCVTEDMETFVKGDPPRRPKSSPQNQDAGLPGCKNLCGNGTCEQIVCLSLGCPCAESPQSCPQDCSPQKSEDW